jgi:hypothetical protein
VVVETCGAIEIVLADRGLDRAGIENRRVSPPADGLYRARKSPLGFKGRAGWTPWTNVPRL